MYDDKKCYTIELIMVNNDVHYISLGFDNNISESDCFFFIRQWMNKQKFIGVDIGKYINTNAILRYEIDLKTYDVSYSKGMVYLISKEDLMDYNTH